MIRVLHIITSTDVGGAERMLAKVLARSATQEIENTVLSLRPLGPVADSMAESGARVLSLELRSLSSLMPALPRLLRIVRAAQPDIVQGWMYHGMHAASFARLFGFRATPTIWNIRHSLFDFNNERFATKRLIKAGAALGRLADRIIYNSNASEEQHRAIGYDSAKALIIPNGFDCEEFRPSPNARSALLRRLAVDGDTLLIGLVARYHPIKDHSTFLRAISELRRLAPGGNFHCILAGGGGAPDEARVRQIIQDLGLESVVTELGCLKGGELKALMQGIDVACLSSRSEAFPNVIGEAMACGVPCVATDVGDTRMLIADTGIVVPSRSPSELACGLARVMCMSAPARLELGRLARARIMGAFSIDAIVHQYERVYENVMGIRAQVGADYV